MKKYLCGLAFLPFLAAPALAAPPQAAASQPVALSDSQMDTVNAGFSLYEVDVSNTSLTVVSVYSDPINTYCNNFYLNISSPAFSLASQFGP